MQFKACFHTEPGKIIERIRPIFVETSEHHTLPIVSLLHSWIEITVLVETDEELKKEARKYQVAIQFYFPILNRDNGKFQVLKTTLGVKNKLDEFHASGINVFESDWILRNTGSKSPRDLYSLVRKDSSEVEPLSDVEKEEYKKAVAFNLMSISENVVKHDPEVEEIEEVFSK